MFEEALIFGGKEGILEIFGDIVEADSAAFLARSIEEIGQKLRLDFRTLDDVAIIEQRNTADAATGKIDCNAFLPSK